MALPACKTVCFNPKKIRALQRQLPAAEILEAAARRHKALGHPARQAIVHTLSHEECCVCDLANVLNMPVSTVSQHLRLLSAAGILDSRQDGKLVFYCLTRAAKSLGLAQESVMKQNKQRKET